MTGNEIGNVTVFPKAKRLTPEDDDFNSPVFHECISGHISLKWLLQVTGKGMEIVCSDCSMRFPLGSLISALEEEMEDGEED